jgi:hypothetical protein
VHRPKVRPSQFPELQSRLSIQLHLTALDIDLPGEASYPIFLEVAVDTTSVLALLAVTRLFATRTDPCTMAYLDHARHPKVKHRQSTLARQSYPKSDHRHQHDSTLTYQN